MPFKKRRRELKNNVRKTKNQTPRKTDNHRETIPMNGKIALFILLCGVLCRLDAQTQYKVSSGVFGNRGVVLRGAGYMISGTLGQSATGEAAASAYRHGAGFWRTYAVLFTGVPNDPSVQTPVAYKLFQSYPNPFNPSSVIGYAVPEISEVTILVCDVRGKLVETLFKGISAPGFHEVVFRPDRFSSGMYFTVMSARSVGTNQTFCDVKKATYVR
jgi:hypothetical protein